jgi:alkylhydroperoxidase family enzyme
MARLPYTSPDIAEPAALVAELRARRGGKLLDVERMMLHSPALAIAWNGFFGGIKNNMQLSPKLRELVACAVGSANGADYQYQQHAAAFLSAGGSAAQLKVLHNPDIAVRDTYHFDQTERAVLQMSLEMTRNIKVGDATFAATLTALDDHQAMVELVGVIAGYNLVSRFLVALDIGSAPAD